MFKSSFEQVKQLLKPDTKGTIATASLKIYECDLTNISKDCKSLRDAIIELPLETRFIESEIEWIRKLHAQYSKIASQVESRSDENISRQRIQTKQSNSLQMEKAEKYGDPTKITDIVINAIQNFKTLREGESRKLLELISTVEDGFNDLKRLGLEKEITTTSSVSIIKRKLPNDLKEEWSKIVCSTKIDKSNKFPTLLAFLREQRKIVEYEKSELRTSNQTKETTHHITVAQRSREARNSSKKKGTHGTSECKVF